jgi:hypothetical protein
MYLFTKSQLKKDDKPLANNYMACYFDHKIRQMRAKNELHYLS